MKDDTRYDPVDALWKGVTVPPLGREEGVQAAKRLYRRFGSLADCSPNVTRRPSYRGAGRRVWISATGGYSIYKGWARLAHDCAHGIFRQRHNRSFRPHDGGHAKLEREVVEYIIAQSWLLFPLRSVAKPTPTPDEKRATKLAALDARIARWTTKAKRAATALRKLHRAHRRLTA